MNHASACTRPAEEMTNVDLKSCGDGQDLSQSHMQHGPCEGQELGAYCYSTGSPCKACVVAWVLARPQAFALPGIPPPRVCQLFMVV